MIIKKVLRKIKNNINDILNQIYKVKYFNT